MDFTKVPLTTLSRGKPVPEIATKTLDGGDFKLSALRGRVVLIDFWATWCAPCVAALPEVEKLYERFGKDGLQIVSISFDKDAATAKKFMETRGITWTQVWAEQANQGPIAKLYAVSGIPAMFLIDTEGRLVGRDLRGSALEEAVATEIAKSKQGY